ncbi:hypothetical protein B5M45_19675 [Mycobacterium simiae]|uniref:AMP-binding enzyme C-terminal domain-containing protein n=1 Tax=Mycobacterium simiae TaxID=1784 RepID=A0A1X0XY88_MYCSI|nr:hypothetical protein B5M45_19675 [Mycobacterium simiae]
MADPVKGELACSYVVRSSGSNLIETQLDTYARSRLSAIKRPRQIHFVAKLPVSSSGKVMRRRLSHT